MIISLIAAVSENYVIGKNNQLVWRLPADMKYFKETTEGHHVLMGRKNYLSIPPKFRPLANRINIVVTRQKNFEAENCKVVHSIEEGIKYAQENGETELFIIGGGEIYKNTIALADKLYITWVHGKFDGDTFFPEINFSEWEKISKMETPSDEKNQYGCSYCIYERRKT